jgi:hypothetical protein
MNHNDNDDEQVLEDMIESLFTCQIINQEMYMQESGQEIMMRYYLDRFAHGDMTYPQLVERVNNDISKQSISACGSR